MGVRSHHSGKGSSPQLDLNIRKKLLPSFIDRDSDGVPNHLEIYKFKTDPFKKTQMMMAYQMDLKSCIILLQVFILPSNVWNMIGAILFLQKKERF